ncbi:hypothetical protein FAM23282_01431 [Lentilactobacillus parabuchneri]|uniref:DUF4355 domain-containing protein n=1 Tax=Lentilactobacillus parabuchneri TaxID=152331 RepID=UPI000A223BC2|nr:DUF4355 domain-containing protein [Lentilactobacillus parabuchneri]ORN39593.1 hypothetical protein FAM23282_01431 [Lentilactobacillus parabuchneri]
MEKIGFYNTLLNLQRFAEGGEGSGEGSDSGEGEGSGEGTGTVQGEEDKPFKAFKTEDEFNSWFDSAYDKRFEKAAENLKAKWEKESKEQKSYDQMTPSEKKEYDLDQAQKKIDQREKEVAVKENRADITSRLAGDKLPVGLAKVFEPTFADKDALEKVYKGVADAFRDAVKTGVDKQLANSANVPGAGQANGESAGATVAEQRNKSSQSSGKSIWSTTK